ncbi:uncharacterized protein LOC113557311 [Rhopalosiphum maidis]|uniref:uncharacterized protein LOC113557311 n=1 Tax=Rhopalosiphum maidis TaxID=43146 RepID=UPI000F001F0A|nr:uncharacterized protein LOC113557311 [Rhopalosiphum maidis]
MTVDNADDCQATYAPPTSLMRDIFRSVDSLMPVPFTGCRLHLLSKTPMLGWPITTVFKLNTDGPKPSGLWMSALYEISEWRGINASAMTDLNPKSGKWNFEAIGRLEIGGNRLDASLAGQVCGWLNPVKFLVNLDYWFPTRTLSLTIDPLFRHCSFQILQSVTDRLSLGVNLAYKRDTSCGLDESHLRPSLVAKYAGPSYLVSGRVSTTSWATKLAYYRHCTDWLQTGTTVDLDPAHSIVTTRLAFRILSDTSVFRAAIDTNGIVSSLWEKRLGDRMAMSLSTFLNHAVDNYGVGIGLSFE